MCKRYCNQVKIPRGCIFIKYYRTLGNIAQTTWIVPPTTIYIQCIRRRAFTVSDTLVGRGDLFIHSHSTLLVSGIIFAQLAFTISQLSICLPIDTWIAFLCWFTLIMLILYVYETRPVWRKKNKVESWWTRCGHFCRWNQNYDPLDTT